jgi:hypothetical protein
MRFLRLLVVTVLVLYAGRTLAAQTLQTEQKNPSAKRDYVRRTLPDVPVQNLLPRASENDNQPSTAHKWPGAYSIDGMGAYFGDPPEQGNDTCLVLHTLVAARQRKGSDETKVVAHYTCTPASRFQTKAAVGSK